MRLDSFLHKKELCNNFVKGKIVDQVEWLPAHSRVALSFASMAESVWEGSGEGREQGKKWVLIFTCPFR